MTGEGRDSLARLGVPQLDQLVVAAGRQSRAVGTELQAVNPSCVSRKIVDFASRIGIPHNNVVVASRCDPSAVGTEGDAQ